MTYCSATHPKKPNHSGHSRGRKIHATEDGKKTICNMKVDQIKGMQTPNQLWYNGKCKICFKSTEA